MASNALRPALAFQHRVRSSLDCVQPRPGEIVADPACGTGCFLLAAHEYLKRHADLDRDQKRHLRFEALAREIADDLRSALGQMEEILADLEEHAEPRE